MMRIDQTTPADAAIAVVVCVLQIGGLIAAIRSAWHIGFAVEALVVLLLITPPLIRRVVRS